MECSHQPCTCLVEQLDGHCSEACAELAGTAEGCPCQHPGCEATPGGGTGPLQHPDVTPQPPLG